MHCFPCKETKYDADDEEIILHVEHPDNLLTIIFLDIRRSARAAKLIC